MSQWLDWLRRSRPRPKYHLRTYFMCAVLAVFLPIILIGGAVALDVRDTFLVRYEETQRHHASALAAALDRCIELTIASSVMAIEADLAPDAPTAPDPVQLQWMHAVMLASKLGGAWWQPAADDGGGFKVQPLVPAYADLPVVSADFIAEVAATGKAAFRYGLNGRGEDMLLIFSPSPGRSGSHGVLELALSADRVGKMLTAGDNFQGIAVTLVAPDGHTLSGSGSDAIVTSLGERFQPLLPVLRAAGTATAQDVTRAGETYTLAYAPAVQAPGWGVLLVERAGASMLAWLFPVGELAAALAACMLFALLIAAIIATRITRPLVALTNEFNQMALHGEPPSISISGANIREFTELRAMLARSTAVLRRRAAAERMALNEARTGHQLLASVITATEDLIYVKNVDLRLMLANSATLALGGVNRREWQVLGRTMAEILPPEAAALEEKFDRRVLAGRESETMRLEWRDRSREIRSFMLAKSLWRDAGGRVTGVVTVARNVTEERAAEAKLAGVQADLLRVSRLSAMGAMASGLAHELNQPLAAATNFLNAAGRLLPGPVDHAGSPDPVANCMLRSAFKDAAEQMLRAGDIVRRLRVFISRGEAELQTEDLGDVIAEACALAAADWTVASPQLVVSRSGAGECALVDRTQLQQVLLNLIRNAAEALDGAPGSRIEVACQRAVDQCILITVSDNGPGLAGEIVPRLFEPFVSTKSDGMGIGLAICRTIVEGHGGMLSAAPRPGGGTVFTIMLPATAVHTDEESRHVA